MPTDGRIRILPEILVNKIAAGEVVDRPASVVKELMENSMDAGAGRIVVTVRGNGVPFMSVADDGCGLSADDALLAFERHATSKIASVEDLSFIGSYGFRGEALPSIAAVSQLTLDTRRQNDAAGRRVEVHGGVVRSSEPAARPPGTTVAVRQLFFNTPARRKFLRSSATERGHIMKTFVRLSLPRPGIRMELILDDAAAYILPSADTVCERLAAIFGRKFMDSLLPVSADDGDMRLRGFVADPRHPPPGWQQHFFVNGRPVEDRLIWAALREGTRSELNRGQAVASILFLELPADAVDVNVHPTKREARFRHPGMVAGLLSRAVKSALADAFAAAMPLPPIYSVHAEPSLGGMPAGATLAAAEPAAAIYGAAGPSPLPAIAPPLQEPPVFLGRIFTGYLAFADTAGLHLIDQHAAHERVLFERVLERLRRNDAAVQPLLIPEEIEVPRRQHELLASNLTRLAEIGLALEPFGPSVFRVISAPAEIPLRQVKEFVAKLLTLLDDRDETVGSGPAWIEKPAALIACHGAVKLTDDLSPEDASRLLSDLAVCREPRQCPHGRPTMITLGPADLERMFGRR